MLFLMLLYSCTFSPLSPTSCDLGSLANIASYSVVTAPESRGQPGDNELLADSVLVACVAFWGLDPSILGES